MLFCVLTFSLGLGLVRTNSDPEKSWTNWGRVEALDASQRARRDLYGTLGLEERMEAICWSSWERCGSVEAEVRNERMGSVVEKTSPGGFVWSLLIFLGNSIRFSGFPGKFFLTILVVELVPLKSKFAHFPFTHLSLSHYCHMSTCLTQFNLHFIYCEL